jgi:DNA-binding LacI/PurR family transcriptional regulator
VLRGVPGPSAATRERVLAAAARLGYRPDRAASVLASRHSRLIGVVMDISNTFHAQLVEDVHEAAERHGYDLLLSTVTRSRNETRAVETLLDSRCEALALLGSELPAEQLTALGRQLPVVVVGRPIPPDGVDVVRAADDEGVARAVDHLVGLGHRDIAHVDGGTMPGATERRRGYRTAMRRHGLDNHIRILRGDYTEESGATAARELLGDQLPTAVFAGNDRCAHGLLDTLSRAGRDVPGDVSIVGYDDSPIASLSFIDLTTIRQDAARMAELAVQAAAERLDEERTTPRDVVLEPTLVVRGTTARR